MKQLLQATKFVLYLPLDYPWSFGCCCCCNRPAGSFCSMQLLSGGPLEAVLPGLHTRLADALLASPPYELRWLNGCQNQVCDIGRFYTCLMP
jgi:hypothetical protein